MQTEVIAIFDIGKTNKKLLLFDKNLHVVFQSESKFDEIKDDDGFECDDIDAIEKWILLSIDNIIRERKYDIKGINFSTYGASLMYLDGSGKRLTPIYNYLKPMSDETLEGFYEKYGGEAEFARRTASPSMKMLNSGLQILWLKKSKPELFAKVKTILHIPQYLSYFITKKISSEYTSIGCHTAMWDFDHKTYHKWLADEGIYLPDPISNSFVSEVDLSGKKIFIGIGIHDSSSSLAPYILNSTDKFILLSTGTWCICMNPFNDEVLTKEELEKDTLCYMSIKQEQVKSSRLFMGHLHEVNTDSIACHFNADKNFYKNIHLNCMLLDKLTESAKGKKVFFRNGIPKNYTDIEIDLNLFTSIEEAYHQLMIDLTDLCVASINLIIGKNDETKKIYFTGGFSKNTIFVELIKRSFPGKTICVSEIANSSALGAAIVIYNSVVSGKMPEIKL
jgi:sugar (pentulose or hexulose) kinase